MTVSSDLDRRPLILRAASEGNWFFVIAGLSLLNALLPYIGLPVFFVAALAAPLIASNRAHLVSSNLTLAQADAVGYAALALCVLVLVALGLFARKGRVWAFVVGGVLYLADGVAFLTYYDYLSFGLHLFILYFLLSGLLEALRAKPNPAPSLVPADTVPEVTPEAAPPAAQSPAAPAPSIPTSAPGNLLRSRFPRLS